MEWTPSPPQPLPEPTVRSVPTIGYFEDAATAEPWSRLVKWVGIIGLILAGADALGIVLQLLPTIGGPTLRPFGLPLSLRGVALLYTIAGWLTSAVLLAGSIGLLLRARLGRILMVVYAVAVLGLTGLSAIGYLSSVSEPGMLIVFLLQSIRQIAFPAIVLAVMRQPPVRRLFGAK